MIGNGDFHGVPNLVIITVVCFALAFWLMRYTQFGRNLYAIGGDYEVARYSGIPVIRTKWIAFVISGGAAGLAGMLLSSKLNTGSSIYGDLTALVVNCGVVVGGTSFAGGIGGIPQSGLGLLVFGMLDNVMNMLAIKSYYQVLLKGAVIVAIIWLDCFAQKRRREFVWGAIANASGANTRRELLSRRIASSSLASSFSSIARTSERTRAEKEAERRSLEGSVEGPGATGPAVGLVGCERATSRSTFGWR